MSARDFCFPSPPNLVDDCWWHSHPSEPYKEAVQWAADKGKERLLALLESAIAVEEPTGVTAADALTIEQRFLREAEKWDRETAYLSSTPKMILHDSYQKIMAMGPDVIPYLLRDLQRNRRSWFWALRHLTNVNPVRPEDQGNLDKMIATWMAWGKREGLI